MAERRIFVSPVASRRLEAAFAFGTSLAPEDGLLVLAGSAEAADDFVRQLAVGSSARLGVHRQTLRRLASTLAAPGLARVGLAPVTGMSLVAVAARATYELAAAKRLSYFAGCYRSPGFPSAVARTIEELRCNAVEPEQVAGLARGGADLAAILEGVRRHLKEAGLADYALVLLYALEALDGPSPFAGLPLLLLDAPVATRLEREFVGKFAATSPAVLATIPRGDGATQRSLRVALNEPTTAEDGDEQPANNALGRLQSNLFEAHATSSAELDPSVSVASWPGEARECTEIARAIQTATREGTPFDRIAVALQNVAQYRSQLEEAFRRAAIPAHFARGTTRPDPAGRAMLALLACAAERLSARRFAEYLSLAQVPGVVRPSLEVHVGDAAEFLPATTVAILERAEQDAGPPLDEQRVRAPWRWEALLVESAVIGGLDRWRRRLDGFEMELRLRLQHASSDAEEPDLATTRLERQLDELIDLRGFALPVLEQLAALPDRAPWSEWLGKLNDLAGSCLREPERVLGVLRELAPMGTVGPVDLTEVRLVLDRRLRELTRRPAAQRYGAVYVGSPQQLRGMQFEIVFVPGLGERVFPRRIIEDPILHDVERRQIEGVDLIIQADRAAAERLAFRIATGAAARRLYVSYSRLDIEVGRPRVPSFYLLEALRAVEGRLPSFDELGRRTEAVTCARLGWPAPADPADAIDEGEYDLSLIASSLDNAATRRGAAVYLLHANPHLRRALRARARRSGDVWSSADGLLLDPGEATRADEPARPVALVASALEAQRLANRSYSATALQHYAACPYRFYLSAVLRLARREAPAPLETMDPLTKGSLFHDTQFAILTELKKRGMLPVVEARLDECLAIVASELQRVAHDYRERLAPAIPRVWESAIASIGADLREWIRRSCRQLEWIPEYFELAFGLEGHEREVKDDHSVPEPVRLAGGLQLRGSIDLVERSSSRQNVYRVTDHKTGKHMPKVSFTVAGGTVLQPVLYALACRQLLGHDAMVEEGRLYFCTADAGFAERSVRITPGVESAALFVAQTIDHALERGVLLAAPARDACRWCDFRPICGTEEEERTRSRKVPARRVTDQTVIQAWDNISACLRELGELRERD